MDGLILSRDDIELTLKQLRNQRVQIVLNLYGVEDAIIGFEARLARLPLDDDKGV